MKKLVSVATVLSISFSVTVNPLHEDTAKYGSIAGGAAAGLAAGGVTFLCIYDSPDILAASKLLISGSVGAGVGGVSWLILNNILSSMTPTARFATANKLVSFVAMDSVVSNYFSDGHELESHASVRFGSSWPLVLTRDHLRNLLEKLAYAYDLISLVANETRGKAEYGDLVDRCNQDRNQISSLQVAIQKRMDLLMSDELNERYLFQVSLYEKNQEKEQQRAEKASQKSQDRLHDSVERERDRQNKKKILEASGNRPVMISV